MGAFATSDIDNNTLYTITTLHDKRAPHATATYIYKQSPMSMKYSKCALFSDDATIYCYSSDNLEDLYIKINHDLYTVADWFRANKLILNISKTNFVILTKSGQARINNKSKQIGHDTINKVTRMLFIGIILLMKYSIGTVISITVKTEYLADYMQ